MKSRSRLGLGSRSEEWKEIERKEEKKEGKKGRKVCDYGYE